MKSFEILRAIMAAQGITVGKLADRLGVSSNTLSMRLSTKRELTLNKFDETLRSLDYKIIVVPRETRLPKDGYEVEQE